MINSDQIQELRELLANWSHSVASDIGTDGIYLFGSLVYRDGAQFVEGSDIDLVILFPNGTREAVARTAWLEKLLERKLCLEKQLAEKLNRPTDSDVICSVVVPTNLEVGADIHKDGAEGFFTSNRFISLLNNSVSDKFPGAGAQPIGDRLIRQCFRFAQKKRNSFLAVAADGRTKMSSFEGTDPLPKDVMRHAAMAARLRNASAPVGAEYDTQAGLDFLTHYLYDARKRDALYTPLHDWVSIRRGARGRADPLGPRDALFMAEIIWDLAADAMEASKAQQDSPRAGRQEQLPGGHSTVFFDDRCAQAFPGVRGISWFDDADEIKTRLLKLLEEPLVFSGQTPIWWWRGGNEHINRFTCLAGRLFLMNETELRIRRIAAVRRGSYYQSFVYVETEATEPTGLYNASDKSISESIAHFGYCDEEYGLLPDGHMVSRAEYDDGAALIEGQLVDIRGKAELRVRYITPYNFVIAAHGSPINNGRFDFRLKELLNAMLRGEDSLDNLVNEVLRLPRREN